MSYIPEGNFVALCGERVIGLGSGFLIDFDFEHAQHSFQEIIDGGFYSHHDPDGDWYYGGDISVHPDYRRRGVGSLLYEARKDVVIRLNRRGIVAGGLIPGYADYKARMTPQTYVDKVVAGELYDRYFVISDRTRVSCARLAGKLYRRRSLGQLGDTDCLG